ncbi:MAG: VCBS repeat-containing protein [Candidatus Sumerlaeia bacterium]|nr:VCBS repeat-containing protein [Candidatus Sumerlaeia bacterium]
MTPVPRMVLVGLLGLLASATGASVFTYEGPRVPIPDGDAIGVEIPLAVSGLTGTVADVKVSLDPIGPPTAYLHDRNNGIDHEYVGDLRLTLVSPAGTQVVLVRSLPATGSDRNFGGTVFDATAATSIAHARGQAPFTGRYRPVGDLTTLQGEAPNGTWKLIAVDAYAGDTGGVNRWSLHVRTTAEAPPSPVVTVASPPLDGTVTNRTQNVTVRGSAVPFAGTVAEMLYRVVPPGGDPALAPWRTPVNESGDWSTWNFTTPLEVGANVLDVLAIDSTGRQSARATRLLVRDEPVYNGPKPDFAGMDQTSDIRVALTRSTGLAPATRWAQATGMRYDTLAKRATLTADVNGDGLADIVGIEADGDILIAFNSGARTFAAPVRQEAEFLFDEYAGWGVFAGDVDGDGRDDLLQLAPAGGVLVALSNGIGFDEPTSWGFTGFTHRPNEEHWTGLGDVTGDGRADLVYVSPQGELWVALSDGETFQPSQQWRATGFFRYYNGSLVSPSSATPVFLADPNGDGRMDVGFLDNNGVVWFCISEGNRFTEPRNWGQTNLVYAPLLGFGWHILTGDVNGDAMMDLVQLSQFGDIKIAPSTGNRIKSPGTAIFATPGFRHTYLGPDRILLADFGD